MALCQQTETYLSNSAYS